jgi:hypothetical protein
MHESLLSKGPYEPVGLEPFTSWKAQAYQGVKGA